MILSLLLSTQAFASVARYSMNFRSGPSKDAGIIGSIPQGAELTLIGSSGEWDNVSYNGMSGWIHGGNIVASVADSEKENKNGTAGTGTSSAGTGMTGTVVTNGTYSGTVVTGNTNTGTVVNSSAASSVKTNSGTVTGTTVSASKAGKLRTTMNLRDKAGMDGNIITVMPKGSALTWLGNMNGWDRVVYGGKVGWVVEGKINFKSSTGTAAQNVSGTTSNTNTAAASTSGTTTNNTTASAAGTTGSSTTQVNKTATVQDTMNFRSSGSMDGSIMGVVPAGSTVTWLSSQNGWDRVIYNGVTGWIKSGVLK